MLQNLCNESLRILVEFLVARNLNKINIIYVKLLFKNKIVQKLSTGLSGKYLYFAN